MAEDFALDPLFSLVQEGIIFSGGRLYELMERQEVLHALQIPVAILQGLDLLILLFKIKFNDFGRDLSCEIPVP